MKIKATVYGKGDSLWGKSKGEFLLTTIELISSNNEWASINVFGPKTEWFQYTDTGIPTQLLRQIRKALKELLGKTIVRLCWSEQGMQPGNGWNFDVKLGKEVKCSHS